MFTFAARTKREREKKRKGKKRKIHAVCCEEHNKCGKKEAKNIFKKKKTTKYEKRFFCLLQKTTNLKTHKQTSSLCEKGLLLENQIRMTHTQRESERERSNGK